MPDIYVFVTDYPTHSILWEVYETDYKSLSEVKHRPDLHFEGADGKVYFTQWPMYGSKERIDNYLSGAWHTQYFTTELIRF